MWDFWPKYHNILIPPKLQMNGLEEEWLKKINGQLTTTLVARCIDSLRTRISEGATGVCSSIKAVQDGVHDVAINTKPKYAKGWEHESNSRPYSPFLQQAHFQSILAAVKTQMVNNIAYLKVQCNKMVIHHQHLSFKHRSSVRAPWEKNALVSMT